jgi:VWFA-related protein
MKCILKTMHQQEGPLDRTYQAFPFQTLAAIALAAGCFALPMRGQTTSPVPSASPRVAPSAGSQQDAGQVTTIRTYTNLVVVDVVVTDSQGNPIHGLKTSDFTLMENNKLQNLRHFEEHSEVPATDIKIAPAPKLPDGLFTNKPPAPMNGPVNVLLLDYLNTPLTSQPNARKQLLDYLDHAAPGTRIAIFGLTTRLIMLQGFTSDMAVLKAALNSKKGAPQVSDIMADAVNGGSITDTSLSNAMSTSPAAVDGMLTQEDVDSINRFQALATSFQQDMVAKYTLNAFDMLARYLIGIPGRKNVIWFSGGFPLNVEPNVNEADPNDSVVRNDDEVRKTDNLLTRAQVAVYPVDARGLMTDPALNFANSPTNISGNSGADTANAYNSYLTQVAQEHETMEAMAEDTGGTPYYNTNGLTQAVQKAIANGSNYYTLTYSPNDITWDARFRAIKVKVAQSGVKLNYRNGYYAIDPNDRNALNAQGAATAIVAQPTTLTTALMHGGPDPAEILFKVRIRPADTPPEAEPLKTNRTNPDPKVKVEGPYKEYGVDLVPDPHAVSCRQEASGDRHCAIEVWTYVYDRDGQLLVTVGNRIYRRLAPADYAKLLAGGMAFHQQISVPVKGEHYLRTAIHDMVSDKVGAVEIPVAAVARLEPLAPLPAVPSSAAAGFTPGEPDAAATAAAPAAGGTAPTGTPAVSVPVSGTPVAPEAPANANPTLRRRPDAPATPPANPPATPN